MEATRSFAFPLLRFLRREERTALDAAQLKDGAAFRLAYADEAAARAGAAALTVDAGRMEQFWRLLALMHRFGLPEPTAFALTLTSAHSPEALLALPRADVVAQLRKLPPLTGVYRSKTVRVDVVEAIS